MVPLEPEKYYHIYNHANGEDVIFKNDRNYHFFLAKYKCHIMPVAQTLAYCLMPNHFHFLIQIRGEKSLVATPTFPKFKTLEKVEPLKKLSKHQQIDCHEKRVSLFISKQFSNLFSSYTQAFNLDQNRKGSLFYKNFRRKEITSEDYFIKLVNYIHFNPVVHGFVDTPKQWKYSSYQAFLSNKETLIAKEETIRWFGDWENFLYCHQFPLANGFIGY
jgi:REP element-mobilizing transposase RayT